MGKSFNEEIRDIRKNIKEIAKKVKETKEIKSKCEQNEIEDAGEVMANLTISYRHLEDASMRLGKVLQAYDGGVSVYDKNDTVGVEGDHNARR